MITVSKVKESTVEEGLKRLSATIHASPPVEVWYEYPVDIPLSASPGDIFACPALLPAMSQGEDLHIEATVSEKLLTALNGVIQDIYLCWVKGTNRINVTANDVLSEPQPGKGAACFFSGGVDSYYTLLKNNSHLDSLLAIHGFDIATKNQTRFEEVQRSLQEAADIYGKRLIVIKTNIREFTDHHGSWKFQHGPCLAAVGHLLSGDFSDVYISSSQSYSNLFVWGSHVLLDPKWSSGSVRIYHEGAEATRVQKMGLIAQHPEAVKRIRVCFKNHINSYLNCGRCEKCLRTMINLSVYDALQDAPFPDTFRLRDVREMNMTTDNCLAFARENIVALEQRGGDEALVKALQTAISNAGKLTLRTRLKRLVARQSNLRNTWDVLPDSVRKPIQSFLGGQ